MGYFDDLIPAQGAPPKPSAMPAGSSPPRKKYPGVIYGTPDPNAGLETRKKTLDVMRSEFDLSDNAEASAIRRTKAAQDSEMHGIQMESERLKLQQLQSDAAKRSGEADEAANAKAKTRRALADDIKRIDRLIKDVNDGPSWLSPGWFETGNSGRFARALPISGPGYSLASELETLKSKNAAVGLKTFADQGNKLTPISNDDIKLAAALIANLDPNADHETFMRALNDTRQHYVNMLQDLGGQEGEREDDDDALAALGPTPTPKDGGKEPIFKDPLTAADHAAVAAYVNSRAATPEGYVALFGRLTGGKFNLSLPEARRVLREVRQGARYDGGFDYSQIEKAERERILREQGVTEEQLRKKNSSALDAIGYNLLDTLTLGGLDEIDGTVATALNGKPLADNIAFQRIKRDVIREQSPKASFAGQIGGAMALPMAGAKTVGQVAKRSAQYGAAYGFGSSDGDLGDRAENAAYGGVVGGLAGAVGAKGVELGGKAFKAVGERIKREPPPNAKSILDSGERYGVDVKTSDIFPPSTNIGKNSQAVGERIPIAGTGSGRAKQQTQREEAVKQLMSEYGASDDAINAVSKNLVETRSNLVSRLSEKKNATIDAVQGLVASPKALAQIDKEIEAALKVKTSGSKDLVKVLKDFRKGLANPKNQLRQVESIRKELGEAFKNDGLANVRSQGEAAIRRIYDPLRDDMADAIRAELGEDAVKAWQSANDRLSSLAGDLKDNALKRSLNMADTRPEAVAKMLFSKNASEITRLYANLSEAGKAKAQAAIIHEAAAKSITDDVISPQKFANAMLAMNKATRVFFKAEDRARVEGLMRLLRATQRASEAAVSPPTGQQLIPFTVGGLIAAKPPVAIPVLSMIGGLARAYESKAMRNLLLGLSKTKPGSKAENDFVQRIIVSASLKAPANDVGKAIAASPGRAAAEDEPNSRREPPR